MGIPQQPTQQSMTPTMTETTANPLGDSGQTRPSPSDPYAFAPGMPQNQNITDEAFPPSPDHFNIPQRPRGDMYQGPPGPMRPPIPPTSMSPTVYPGSPVRPQDPGFR